MRSRCIAAGWWCNGSCPRACPAGRQPGMAEGWLCLAWEALAGQGRLAALGVWAHGLTGRAVRVLARALPLLTLPLHCAELCCAVMFRRRGSSWPTWLRSLLRWPSGPWLPWRCRCARPARCGHPDTTCTPSSGGCRQVFAAAEHTPLPCSHSPAGPLPCLLTPCYACHAAAG